MEWLGNWLRSVILVILLATFVDILLPGQTMQRYVKTVMSLFILLTLLSPLLSLFQKHVPLDQLLGDAMFARNGSPLAAGHLPGGAGQMQSLGAIQRQAEQLKSRQEEQSRRIMQQQIESLMKQSIEQSSPVKVLSVSVDTGKDGKGQARITDVRVQVAPAPAGSGVSTGTAEPVETGRQPIKPVAVEPVTINVNPQGRLAADESSASGDTPGRYEQQRTQIRMNLSKEWEIPLESIAVEVVGDKTKS